MRLKTFHAKSMTEALRQIKETLGEDAIIVATRDEPGGFVRVTAAAEQASEPRKPETKGSDMKNATRATSRIFTPQEADDSDSLEETLTGLLLAHRTPAAVSDKILAVVGALGMNQAAAALESALAATFRFEPLPLKRHPRPLVLVGPPGAGKTLTAAKLAARATLNGLKASVITTDTARAGGIEQLQAFLDILSIELKTAQTPQNLRAQLDKSLSADQIIVDTGGLNPFDPAEMKELALLLKTEDADAVLVLPAGGDAEESAEIAMTFGLLGVRRILPTRLDFARRLGGILTAADRAGMAFSDASHTPSVAMGLLQLSPKSLADILLPMASHNPKTKTGGA